MIRLDPRSITRGYDRCLSQISPPPSTPPTPKDVIAAVPCLLWHWYHISCHHRVWHVNQHSLYTETHIWVFITMSRPILWISWHNLFVKWCFLFFLSSERMKCFFVSGGLRKEGSLGHDPFPLKNIEISVLLSYCIYISCLEGFLHYRKNPLSLKMKRWDLLDLADDPQI